MAHIPDGVLSVPVLITGAVVSIPLAAYSLRSLTEREIPRTAVMAAAFFVASLVSFPVGPATVHLLLGGLMGLILGIHAVPAILTALILQFFLFGYGGLLVMGVNLWILAVPALLVAWLKPALLALKVSVWISGFVAGVLSAGLTALLLLLNLVLTDSDYATAASVIALSYLPLMLIEGLITAVCLTFLVRAAPELIFREKN